MTVSVILRETGTTNLRTQGLIAGDFRVLFNESPRVSTPARAIARVLNPAFDAPLTWLALSRRRRV